MNCHLILIIQEELSSKVNPKIVFGIMICNSFHVDRYIRERERKAQSICPFPIIPVTVGNIKKLGWGKKCIVMVLAGRTRKNNTESRCKEDNKGCRKSNDNGEYSFFHSALHSIPVKWQIVT